MHLSNFCKSLATVLFVAGSSPGTAATASGYAEAIACPPTPGDLDSALFDFAAAIGFQQRIVDGVKHYTKALPDSGLPVRQYFDIEFQIFPMAASTRVIAQTTQISTGGNRTYSPRTIAIQDEAFVGTLQSALYKALSAFPCPTPKR